jgi:hypothetical protein
MNGNRYFGTLKEIHFTKTKKLNPEGQILIDSPDIIYMFNKWR